MKNKKTTWLDKEIEIYETVNDKTLLGALLVLVIGALIIVALAVDVFINSFSN